MLVLYLLMISPQDRCKPPFVNRPLLPTPMPTEEDKEYLKQHNIPALFNDLTQELFRERPENPVLFLVESVKKKRAAKAAAACGQRV